MEATIPSEPESLLLSTKLIKEFEGCELRGYLCPAKVWTIGYGNTEYLKKFPNPAHITITKEEAETLLKGDIIKYYKSVIEETKNLNLKPNQIASLTSLCFNIGINAFKGSSLLKCIKRDKEALQEINHCFLMWIHAGGSFVRGLRERRQREFDFYAGD